MFSALLCALSLFLLALHRISQTSIIQRGLFLELTLDIVVTCHFFGSIGYDFEWLELWNEVRVGVFEVKSLRY